LIGLEKIFTSDPNIAETEVGEHAVELRRFPEIRVSSDP
jgi:hypothetical protein